MFKNLSVYRIAPGWSVQLQAAEDALANARFVPCAPTQDRSVGWVPPREENGALVESVAGQWIMKLMIQTKSVPGAMVREHADKAAVDVEQTTGRKPGKKEMKALREDALLILLPQAFPRSASVLVWIDRAAGLLVTDAVGGSKLDLVITALVNAFNDLPLTLLQTNLTPQTAMTTWLSQDAEYWPVGFNVERACELKGCDEEKAVVKFNRHNLCTTDIRKHISEGKLPTNLALSYDGRVGFVLTEHLQLKKIAFLEGVFDGNADGDDAFDADVVLTTGELQKLIPALIDALGGDVEVAKPATDVFGE